MKKCGVRKRLAALVVSTVAGMLVFAGTAMADEEVSVTNGWINMEKGPGVAQWVDEQGNVSEQTGVRPDSQSRGAGRLVRPEESGPGAVGQADGQTGSQTADSSETAEASELSEAGNQLTEETGRTIDPLKPMVALTFDDGPLASVGNRILDCLAQYESKATFYVVGDRCASYPEEMQRIAAEGHEIGNHTYSHKYLNRLGASEIQSQIQRGAEAIQATAGVAPPTVRLPGGNKNSTVLANVNAPIIMWSIDTLDWKTKDAQATIDAVLGKVKDGDIVLMHELYSTSADAAVQLIPALVERGYQLVTVSEMAQHRGGLENGKIYYNFYQQ